MAEVGERRLRVLRVPPNIALAAFRGRAWLAEELPADIEIVAVNADWESQSITVLLRSDSFDVVPEGESIPVWSYAVKFKPVAEDEPRG